MDLPPELADHFNRIGIEALSLAESDDDRVLLYAEVTEDTENAFVRYARRNDRKFQCAADLEGVPDALRDAWEFSRSLGAEHAWTAVVYRINDRKISVDLLYANDVDLNASMYDKEEKLLEKHYPGMEFEEDCG